MEQDNNQHPPEEDFCPANQLVSSIWGSDRWSVMHHAPCKNGRLWIVTDNRRDVWDLVKWDRGEWVSERGIEMNMTHCKLLSIGATTATREEILQVKKTSDNQKSAWICKWNSQFSQGGSQSENPINLLQTVLNEGATKIYIEACAPSVLKNSNNEPLQ